MWTMPYSRIVRHPWHDTEFEILAIPSIFLEALPYEVVIRGNLSMIDIFARNDKVEESAGLGRPKTDPEGTALEFGTMRKGRQ